MKIETFDNNLDIHEERALHFFYTQGSCIELIEVINYLRNKFNYTDSHIKAIILKLYANDFITSCSDSKLDPYRDINPKEEFKITEKGKKYVLTFPQKI